MKQLASLLLVGWVVTMVLINLSYAEDMGSISSGETRSGEIMVGGEDTWTFTASAGDRVVLCVAGSLSEWLTLYGPDGSELLVGDFISYTTNQTGTHTLVISSSEEGAGGSYNITFINLTTCPKDTVSCDATRSGSIDHTADLDVWQFSGTAGDHVMFCVLETSGSLRAIGVLYGPDGIPVRGFRLDTYCGLGQTGTYTLLIYDGQDPDYTSEPMFDDTGTYNITLVNLDGCSWPTITCNETRSGTIEAVTDIDVWKFSAGTADRVMISAVGTGGDLYPFMRIYAPDNSQEASDDLLINQLMSQTGEYTLVVYDGDTGANDIRYDKTGDYNITFLNVDDCSGTPIAGNETRSGSIDAPSDMDMWQFSASDGDHISVDVVTTSGSLYPYIILYCPNGTGTLKGYHCVEWDATRTGTYKVVIYDGRPDSSGIVLQDTGDYEITVMCGAEDAKPDLVVSSLSISQNPVAQTDATVSWTIQNEGEVVAVPLGYWLRVRLSEDANYDVSDALLGQTQINDVLATGDTYSGTCTLPWTAFTAGDYYLVAMVDDGAAVDESSETNNVRSASVTIGSSTSPKCTLAISSGVGGSVTTPGEGTYSYAPSSSASVVATVQDGYAFSNWSGTAVSAGKVGNASAAATTVTVDADYTLVANFTAAGQIYALNTSSSAGGSVTVPGEGTYNYGAGSSVSVAATAQAGYAFSSWSGTAVSAGKVANTSAATTTVTMDADYTLVANFMEAAETYTLSVSSSAGGSVTTPGEGAFSYEADTVVTVQAVVTSDYAFSNWSGTAVSAGKVANPSAAFTTVTVDADYTLVANFTGQAHTLEVASTAGGWVTSPGEGAFSYGHGQTVLLEAQAQPGYHFTGWSGSLCAANNPLSVEMDASYQVTANFTLNPPVLTVTAGDGGRVVVPGEGQFTYESGTVVRAVAMPEAGYVFAGWTGTPVEARAVADPNAARVDFVLEADSTLSAGFAQAGHCLYVDVTAAGTAGPDGTWEHPFGSIQEAIEVAEIGDTILVLPGTYNEHLDFAGKDIMVSAFDLCTAGAVSQTVLSGTNANSVVVFEAGESAAAVLAGFTIQGGDGDQGGGIRCCGADPVIANCLIAGNRAEQGGGVCCLASAATLVNCTIADNFAWVEGGGLYCDSDVTVINSILYGNGPEQIVADPCQVPGVTYSDIQGGWAGGGNIRSNPRFAEPGYWALPSDSSVSVNPDDPAATWLAGDYHLKATEGRWNGWSWLCDGSTSPCVDAGSPTADVRCEPTPHGGRINMGAFGGTAEASQSDL